MEGTARTRPDFLKVVLGPYVQYCPCEASEQKLGQKQESELKVIELRHSHHSICLLKTSILKKKDVDIGRKMTKFMFLCQSGIWPILCQLMAILAKLLDMDFKFFNFLKLNTYLQLFQQHYCYNVTGQSQESEGSC